ncbi:MAG: hypothetical protein ACD_61C00282G0014 [uncultured bacterium]|nr:MAG: hypothetical protein ACD_61C00282G0014 [uncultured bacterium]
MIIYQSTKKGFVRDVLEGYADSKILTSYVRETGHSTSLHEQESWRNSMQYMKDVMQDVEIPDDAGVAIEYKIPQTSKRIDFILTGNDNEKKKVAIIVELKQWSKGIHLSEKDGVLGTDFYEGESPHPSYQAWSYTTLLTDYNSSIEDKSISLVPCAYLHNYEADSVIDNVFYKEYLEKAPVFFKHDLYKLQSFIKKFVKYGDKGDTIFDIENGKIRPSKSLADSLNSMLHNNKEFVLIDDQKLVYEMALDLTRKSTNKDKNVLIVEGGPGTGKSVVAINLLVELNNQGKVTFYVTKNSAPREVYQVMLTGKFTKSRISNMFSSSGSFINVEKNSFDALIVDEAHRLNAKSGLFSNLGENQVKELIEAAKSTVFFVDEDQMVTVKDIGTKEEITKWAEKLGAKVTNMTLSSQFRCNGSDGFLAWLDNVLQIRPTATDTLREINYDFRVVDSPALVHMEITGKNSVNNKSRVVAGYCWKWISQNNPNLKDIVIGDYTATWNLKLHGQSWIIQPNSVSEVGCIHTCQGLELDYVGVIIGPDLVVRNGKIITDATKRASTDQSLKGFKKMLKENPENALKIADKIIKNTYRTLMTRGMKGCYIYSTDTETQQYFKNQLILNSHQETRYTDVSDGTSVNIDN